MLSTKNNNCVNEPNENVVIFEKKLSDALKDSTMWKGIENKRKSELNESYIINFVFCYDRTNAFYIE